jgi:hypothetical protein
MDPGGIATIIIIVVLVIIILSAAIKVFPEYQRGVIFRLGRINPQRDLAFLSYPHRRSSGAGRSTNNHYGRSRPGSHH